jgi:hypothetical protein
LCDAGLARHSCRRRCSPPVSRCSPRCSPRRSPRDRDAPGIGARPSCSFEGRARVCGSGRANGSHKPHERFAVRVQNAFPSQPSTA